MLDMFDGSIYVWKSWLLVCYNFHIGCICISSANRMEMDRIDD